jgi:FimV-like protein
MSSRRERCAGWLACATLLVAYPGGPAQGQEVGASYEVRRGDTLFAIARRARPEGIDVNQMLLAIHRLNPEAFAGGIGTLRLGQALRIPTREEAAAVTPADARRQVQDLVSKPVPKLAAVPREAPPKPVAKPPVAPPPAKALLGPEEAARRYREGLAMEGRGDEKGALKAFLEAGESGHGPAQRRLGEIYDKGNSAVERDYESAIRWYQRARERGEQIPKPITRAPR